MRAAEQVAAWNASVEVGAKVYFGPTSLPRFTRAAAQVLSDGRAVVWLAGLMGAVDLESLRPA